MLRRTKRSNKMRSNECGFALLEYCAGAAVIAAVIWGAFYALGGDIKQFMTDIGTWAKNRGTEVSNTNAPANSTSTGSKP